LIDTDRACRKRARSIDRRESTAFQQEAMVSGAITIIADDVADLIDAERISRKGSGKIDRGESSCVRKIREAECCPKYRDGRDNLPTSRCVTNLDLPLAS
jgi:hypothetical protein